MRSVQISGDDELSDFCMLKKLYYDIYSGSVYNLSFLYKFDFIINFNWIWTVLYDLM